MDKKEATFWMIVGAVDDAIKEAGEKGIPEGHLYSFLAEHFKISLESFNGIISLLEKGKKVRKSNHLLTAIL